MVADGDVLHTKLASLMDMAASMMRDDSEEDADVAHVLQTAAQHLATVHSDAWAVREQVGSSVVAVPLMRCTCRPGYACTV